jgi:hypothetical protein
MVSVGIGNVVLADLPIIVLEIVFAPNAINILTNAFKKDIGISFTIIIELLASLCALLNVCYVMVMDVVNVDISNIKVEKNFQG